MRWHKHWVHYLQSQALNHTVMSSDFKSPRNNTFVRHITRFHPSLLPVKHHPSVRKVMMQWFRVMSLWYVFSFFPSYMRLWLLRRCFSFSPSALREKWSMESLQSTCRNIGSHTFIMGALTSASIFSGCETCPNSGRMLVAAVDPVKSRGGLSVRDSQGISQKENVQLKLRMYIIYILYIRFYCKCMITGANVVNNTCPHSPHI